MPDAKELEKDDSTPATTTRSRAPLYAGAGFIVLIALGWLLSIMAVPSGNGRGQRLEGPFVTPLSRTELTVNLSGHGGKDFLILSLSAEYSAYDPTYVTGRLGTAEGTTEDPLYITALKDALVRVTSTKTRDQATNPALVDGILEEIRIAVEPILFPVCVGDTRLPSQRDSRSGLRVGETSRSSSWRGFLHEHFVDVDAVTQRAVFDSGPTVHFEGNERDLRLVNEHGDAVWIDVSTLEKGFAGRVPIGVPGRVSRIYRDSFLVQ